VTSAPSSAASPAASPAERDAPSPGRATRRLVLRSVKLPAALAACTLILALVAFGIVAWRGMQRLEPVNRHLSALVRLQQTVVSLEERSIQGQKGIELSPSEVAALRADIASIITLDGYLAPGTSRRLRAASEELADPDRDPDRSLLATIRQIQNVFADEIQAHGRLLTSVRHDLALEFIMTGAAVIVLSGLGVLVLVRMRTRVFRPLDTLEQLLSHLAKRDYSLAPTEGVDPIVQPLTASYNHLVNRLVELEGETARHRDTLEREVRTVTEALLEQHRNLAAAERLAAVGEVAARIAHELRNPLAGMQMALSNIRTECKDRGDVVRRLDLVIDELRRVTGLLNGLLDQSRISPETAVDLHIGKTIDELLAIVRYQIPKGIKLRRNISKDIVCHLPKDRLRQMLLNLILNSADAIGERGGTIALSATTANGMLELSVRDDGPGFPPDLLREGISPHRTGRLEGTGLGLSIVARLVRNLGGQLDLRNIQPHGAWVRMTLPCRGPHA
jgi:two-component system NtrC family sensor kinase